MGEQTEGNQPISVAGAASESAAPQVPAQPTTTDVPSVPPMRRLWDRASKHPVLSAVMAAVLLSWVAPIVAPVPSIPGKTFDNVRDYFRSFDGQYADGLKEYAETSDVWSGKKQIFDEAFANAQRDSDFTLMPFASDSGPGSQVGWVSADDVFEDPSSYAGQPNYIVARVDRSRTLPDAEYNGSPITVVEASGQDGLRVFAIPSGYLQDASGVEDGQVVAFRGVLAGIGTTDLGGDDRPAVMLLASEAFVVEPPSAPVDGEDKNESEDPVLDSLNDFASKLRKLPPVPPG